MKLYTFNERPSTMHHFVLHVITFLIDFFSLSLIYIFVSSYGIPCLYILHSPPFFPRILHTLFRFRIIFILTLAVHKINYTSLFVRMVHFRVSFRFATFIYAQLSIGKVLIQVL